MLHTHSLLTASLLAAPTALAATDFSVTSGLSNWNQEDWSLTTNTFIPGQFQSRVNLANGYVGASIAAAGPFFEIDLNQTDPNGVQPINGWPLFNPRISFSTISGFYDVQPNATGTNYPWLNQYGWESLISGIPHPTAIIFAFEDSYLDAKVNKTEITNFTQKMSFKTGVAEWNYTWSPSTCEASFYVSYTVLFSRQRPNVIAVSASITPTSDATGTVSDVLDGRSAIHTYLNGKGMAEDNATIYTSVHPDGLNDVTAFLVSGVLVPEKYTDISSRELAQGPFLSVNDSTIGQTFNVTLKKGETATFHKFVGVASTDKFPDAESVARDAQASAQSDGWDALLGEHTAAWAAILAEDLVDDFRDPVTGDLPSDEKNKALHIASVANAYYLLQNMQPDGSGLNDNSISVGGLGSDSYAGLIFWDADYWMAPGLNLAFPGWAKQISNFRVKQYPQSLKNAEFNGYPEGSALYSWTSGRYGNCTGTGPCADYQYHLNHDIAFNFFQLANITNNKTWFNDGPRQIIESIAVMTSNLLKLNETTKKYWIYNMTDPDEYANNIDNGAFTLASASELLRDVNALRASEGMPINNQWEGQYENIDFPRAPTDITLEYQTMNNSVTIKQADVVLLTYPLDYGVNYTAKEKLLDLDYYANKQSPDGPAMTYSVFAINANAISPSGCSAYAYTLTGFLPYLRAPWYQFSEQEIDDVTVNGGTNPAFPFLTGHGGANQVVPFGFLGVRTDQPVLYLNPSLPPQIPNVKVRNLYYAGATLSASLNRTHTTITRLNTPAAAGMTDAYANIAMPFIVGTPNTDDHVPYTISVGQTLTISNRLYWSNNTHEGNLIQCLPVSSTDATTPGQFPVGAVDGASSTRWQPATNDTATIVVDTSSVPPAPVSELFFDWGTRPPHSAVVYFGNGTSGSPEFVIAVEDIQPSEVYNATEVEAMMWNIRPTDANTTTVKVPDGIWSGEWARLVVEGCWEEDGKGATVAEFVIVGSNV